MPAYYLAGNSVSGVTEYAKNTAYTQGAVVVPNRTDTGTNHATAKRYVWECTTAGTTDTTNFPTWDASYTPDVSTETSGTATFTCRNPGYSSGTTANWNFATLYFSYAVLAATSSGDIIYVDQGLTDILTADSTFTFLNNVNVICTNDTSNYPPQTLGSMGTTGYIGHSSTSYSIIIGGAYKVYLYGITFRVAGSSIKTFQFNNTDGGNFEFENCYFWCGNTATSTNITFGSTSFGENQYTELINCIFRFAATAQKLIANSFVDIYGGVVSNAGSTPSTLFGGNYKGILNCNGFDMGLVTGTLIDSQPNGKAIFVFSNCRLGSGVTVLATQTPANKSSASAWLYNCSSTTQYYHISHHDAFGSTVCDTGIYANDGASYDGTNRLSWKIVTTANCNYYTPYFSPWIDCYHNGTSAITPYLEILRDGSTTDYQDDEVWGEFSYQGTDNNTLAIIVNDRKSLLASATDQADGVGTSGWTGEAASAWSGKLSPTSSITPYEIGHLRARVCVGEPSITVYVDPQIRGRS